MLNKMINNDDDDDW